ncbi:MAG: TlpA family protein disulfide reductase [Lewinellaceae bacterium]|nr:TlpA family protein disulfide reductase [Saprospiraceae bacterium]MCB9356387.1 TlpA family protein disulfide reductase [Lewinellaceae bacterium]
MNNSTLMRIGLLLLAAVFVFAWYRYRQPRFRAGEQAPELEITLIDGRKAHLSDLRGHYTLLHFWGSWCGPCRAENPQLVRIYRKYHPDGFEIFSVGIEQREAAWRSAIEKDGLIWPYHAMESRDFDGGATSLFNVKSIPSTFLLNPEGDIIGVNLLPEQIEHLLAEKLAER